jgi:hypothetical protein
MIELDATPFTLAASRMELALLRQKLAMKRMAFEFEIRLIKARDEAEIANLFYSQKKLVI